MSHQRPGFEIWRSRFGTEDVHDPGQAKRISLALKRRKRITPFRSSLAALRRRARIDQPTSDVFNPQARKEASKFNSAIPYTLLWI
jgi:hypothetical protein